MYFLLYILFYFFFTCCVRLFMFATDEPGIGYLANLLKKLNSSKDRVESNEPILVVPPWVIILFGRRRVCWRKLSLFSGTSKTRTCSRTSTRRTYPSDYWAAGALATRFVLLVATYSEYWYYSRQRGCTLACFWRYPTISACRLFRLVLVCVLVLVYLFFWGYSLMVG